MNRCNLSFRRLKSYTELRVKREFPQVSPEDGDSAKELLKTSDKDKKFMRTCRSLKALMM